jgi:hypothetical protein
VTVYGKGARGRVGFCALRVDSQTGRRATGHGRVEILIVGLEKEAGVVSVVARQDRHVSRTSDEEQA